MVDGLGWRRGSWMGWQKHEIETKTDECGLHLCSHLRKPFGEPRLSLTAYKKHEIDHFFVLLYILSPSKALIPFKTYLSRTRSLRRY